LALKAPYSLIDADNVADVLVLVGGRVDRLKYRGNIQ
jgi:hypothetical protein